MSKLCRGDNGIERLGDEGIGEEKNNKPRAEIK